MKFNKEKNTCGRINGWLGRLGRSSIAMLLVLVMVAAMLPVGGGYRASAEGAIQEISGSDTQVSAEAAPAADGRVVSSGDIAEDTEEEHICVIRRFAGHVPGEPIEHITLPGAMPLNRIKDMLPKKLQAVIDCEDCSTEIEASWKNIGTDRFELVLDGEKYSYEPQDDPATEDIDESAESPWCDLPFVSVTIEGLEEVSASDISPSDVSGSDAASDSSAEVSDTDVVTGSDVVSDSDAVSGSDVISGSDAASGSDAVADKPVQAPAVSDSDFQVLPLCTCDTHCYANPEAGLYLVNIKCPACSVDPEACLVDPERAEKVLEVSASDGRVVTVEGALPEGASLSVEPIAEEIAAELMATVSSSDAAISGSDAEAETVICFAYDIKVIYEGREYQPSDFGDTVTVSIHDVETAPSDVLTVYHFHEDEVECLESALNEENTVSFVTDGFSYYVGSTLKTDAPPTVYVYRYRSEEGNTAVGRTVDKMYFYCDENGWKNHTNELKNSSNQPFATIGAILTYFPDADIDFILQGTYIVAGSEVIDGTGRNITITRHASHPGGDENGFDVGYNGKSLTLKNVTLDGINRAVASADQAMVKAYREAVINIQEGTVIQNCNSHGVLIMTNSTVNMSGGTISNCYAKLGDTRGAVTRKGGGVYVDETSTFNMSGGTISGCSAKDAGGGVYIAAGVAETGTAGKMTMTGGTITGCSVDTANASYGAVGFYGAGGGIYVEGAASTDGIGRVAPYGYLKISGGTISNNTAENGGGVANSGDMQLVGGTISGNTAVDSGGGIFNSQQLVMTGGSIINNTANSHSGGGMMLYGYKSQAVMASTLIEGGIISGNKTSGANGVESGDGIMVYNYTTSAQNFRHHLMLSGEPTIADIVCLGINSDSGERDISLIRSDDFNPGSVIKLAVFTPSDASSKANPLNFPVATVYDQSGGHSDGKYVITDHAKIARVLSKFTLVNPGWYIKQGGNPGTGADLTANGNTSSTYHIVIAESAAKLVYFDKNAASGGDGSNPAKAFNNMASAYNALATNGGTIYMVSDYEPSGVVVMGCRSFSGEGASVTTKGDVQIKRYVKPSSGTYSSWKASNSGSLITVNSGSTLSLAGLTVDGHNSEIRHLGAQINAPAQTTADSAMIQVMGGGSFTVTGYTRLIDAPSSSKGGAIYAADTAVVTINDEAVFSGNSGTAVGSSGMGECIYVGGDNAVVTLKGYIHTNGEDIHLGTSASKVHLADNQFTTEDGELELTLGVASHCYSGRVVAVFDSGVVEISKLRVSNHEVDDFTIHGDGNNVILPHGGSFDIYAAPKGVILDYANGEFVGFGYNISDLYEIVGDKNSVTISATARIVEGDAVLEDYRVVEENADKWGTEKARNTFAFQLTNACYDEKRELADVFSGESVTAYRSEDPDDWFKIGFDLLILNANAITESRDNVATIEFDVSVNGYVKTFTARVHTRGATMSVTVPLKITGVADTNGSIYMPTPEAYQITNNSVFPVEITDIEWKWESGAGEMFADVGAMSSQVVLSGSDVPHSFAGDGIAADITDGKIAAESALGLDWDMLLGADNYIKSTVTRHVATITYTIDATKN